MIKDITLGQFFPGTSTLHKLDPRMKLVLMIIYIVGTFLAKTVLAYAFCLLFTVTLVILSQIKLSVILKGLKPILFLIILTAVFNLFLVKGEGEPLIAFWKLSIYADGIVYAVTIAVRIMCIITGTSVLLTYTTSPIALTDGLERLLAPLKRIKVPVHDFSMMMTMALRFIPTLLEETEKIMNAQKARGANFTTGGLIKRGKALLPILIPLFLSAIRRAEDLATAMECRCYRGGDTRTKMVELRYTVTDLYLAIAIVLWFTAVILFNTLLPIGNF